MLTSYHFSLRGKAHQRSGKPCHDSSAIVEITPAWKAILVADGVGSCKHAEIASDIAVKTASALLKAGFPDAKGTDRDFQSLLLTAGHAAANAIEHYVEENDPDNEKEYHTTLAMALCSKHAGYYFSVGDSAIIGLEEDTGLWHSVTHQDNSGNGGVYTLAYRDHYHVGKVKFKPSALLAVTDGIYEACFPLALNREKFNMNVPLLNFFVTYAFGISEEEEKEATEQQCENIKKYLNSEECSYLTDDLSISAVICTDTDLQESDIPYEAPDWIDVYWKLLQYRPYSEENKRKQFENFLQEHHPDLSPKEVREMADRYISPETPVPEVSGKELAENAPIPETPVPEVSGKELAENTPIPESPEKQSVPETTKKKHNRTIIPESLEIKLVSKLILPEDSRKKSVD